MKNDIRLNVLNKSLEIENYLSDIIREIIRIPKIKTKTLSNQSSSISFKTKVDLLYDLDRLTKDEYNLLILFMEIRNQFIHNIYANSFIKTFEFLEKNKINQLLKVDNKVQKLYSNNNKLDAFDSDLENILELAFDSLFIKIINIISNQHKKIKFEIEKELEQEYQLKNNKIYSDIIFIIMETTKEFGEIWDNTIKKQTNENLNFSKILSSYINQKSIEKIKIKYPEFIDKTNI